ncbi:hypothetical protein N0V90_007914 [Kalmusia sp. IMI 367209]|nr:hypothetical protein N0V90_007914 [Kalmusia sp. IMI 367209]
MYVVDRSHFHSTDVFSNKFEDVQTEMGMQISASLSLQSYDLSKLYDPSVEAKIWGVAVKGTQQDLPPMLFPEYTRPGNVSYVYRELDFWTSGFFPGSLYLLLERKRKYPHAADARRAGASKTGNSDMFAAAIQHARTTARTHIRSDGSTTHLIVLDACTGNVKHRLTNQGYSHTSCWARGQAWAIAGFAETYHWTHDEEFLRTSRLAADFFLARLPMNKIVPWDFDALEVEGSSQPPDSSAAMIAAYGMLLIHQALVALGNSSPYLTEALKIIQAVCENHMNPAATLVTTTSLVETVEHGPTPTSILGIDVGVGESILNGATINNYKFAPRRWANHGLVYADYYFLLVGNKLLEMDIMPHNMG